MLLSLKYKETNISPKSKTHWGTMRHVSLLPAQDSTIGTHTYIGIKQDFWLCLHRPKLTTNSPCIALRFTQKTQESPGTFQNNIFHFLPTTVLFVCLKKSLFNSF